LWGEWSRFIEDEWIRFSMRCVIKIYWKMHDLDLLKDVW
jgi:hypothetical protein